MAARGRSLGIDFGLSRVGLAMSDPMGILASALETLNWDGQEDAWIKARIVELCRKHDIVRIVLGLPRRTDGKESRTEILARRFGSDLEALCHLPVIYKDERFTTVLASRILNESSLKGSKQKRKVIDQVAAVIILQDYLDAQR